MHDPLLELLEVSTERVVATMPVEGNTQPYGLLHGGASVVLAETLPDVSAPTPVACQPTRVLVDQRLAGDKESRRSQLGKQLDV